MRTARAEKYRQEVRKANTGLNRRKAELEKMRHYRDAVACIRKWAENALKEPTEMASWMKAIAKKCKRVTES